jgi:3-hydroxyisobutyrate dehydrogenase-like beta-hydroxyacid dehydrogenase
MSEMTQPIKRIAIIGFGEVGSIFGTDFAIEGIDVSVYDILLGSKGHREHMLSKARACGVRAADDLKDCVRDAEVVISAVTATSALDVARKVGPLLEANRVFLDINSVSPETKLKAAKQIERRKTRSKSAHFVEAAVMEAVPRHRLKVPMLLGGAHAAEVSVRLQSIGMNPAPLSDQVGVASAVKMCRSVMIKGLEALAVECLFAARRYGAEDAVLESLAATYPSLGWKDHLPDYMISRIAEHGTRRAAEMREVAKALRSAGIKPMMTLATADRQEKLVQEMAERNFSFESSSQFSWRSLADTIARSSSRRSKRKL